MTTKCVYPQCQKCEYDYCIKDDPKTSNLPPKKRDRSAYYKEYYQRKKNENKATRKSYKHYVKYTAVRDAVSKLKKQIGEVNYNLVMDAINQLNDEEYRA